MNSILVPVEDCDGLRAQLATALLLAGPFAGHIDGIAPRPVVGTYVFGDGMSGAAAAALESLEQQEEARAERAQAEFRKYMNDRGLAWGDPLKPSDHVTVDWLGQPSPGDDAIAQSARLYDISVVARPVAGAPVPRSALLETILFDSGRPILVAPPETPTAMAEVIVISWNSSTESARSVAMARHLLERARRVVVLEVEGGSVEGPNGADLARALRRAGIPAEAQSARAEGRSIGEAILAETARAGADLLIKGAFTHSRLRQMIFGGATSHILSGARLPVFMAN